MAMDKRCVKQTGQMYMYMFLRNMSNLEIVEIALRNLWISQSKYYIIGETEGFTLKLMVLADSPTHVGLQWKAWG